MMLNDKRPSKTAYTLAVQIEVLSMLLKEKKQLVEAAFVEFPTEKNIYADESGARSAFVIKAQAIRGHLADAIGDIDELLKHLERNERGSVTVAPDELKKISEFGG